MASAASRPEISIVVPVYNEETLVAHFHDVVSRTLAEGGISDVEYVFVDDGSIDSTWDRLTELAQTTSSVVAVRLSRNAGKEAALHAGLTVASGLAQVPMDVDLQDPPEVVVEMHKRWKAGALVVLARRRTRDEGAFKRWSAAVFYRLLNLEQSAKIPAQVGDFRLIDRRITQRFLDLPERVRFNKGLLALVGSRSEIVDFERPARANGTAPAQSFRKLVGLAVDGLASFTVWPLRAIAFLGGVLLAFAIVAAIVMFVFRLTGMVGGPGQATIILLILGGTGFQALSLGVIGEYIGTIVLEVKGRPSYFIDEVVGAAATR